MNTAKLTFFNKPIYAYSIFVYVGMISGLVVSNIVANLRGADSFAIFIVALLLIFPGWVGVRALFYLTRWKEMKSLGIPFWDTKNGGASLFGAFPVVLIVSVPLTYGFDIGFVEFWDINVFGVLTGMAIGRLGCFEHGCCGGKTSNSRFAMLRVDLDGQWRKRFPIQVVEAILLILIVLFGLFEIHRFQINGQAFIFLGSLYLICRGVLDEFKDYQWAHGEKFIYRSISVLGLVIAAISFQQLIHPV